MFRLRIGFIVIAMVLSFFGARLVQLQAIDPKSYAAMAKRDGVQTVELPAERGAIVDRTGIELAASVDGMMVIGDPELARDDAPQIARILVEELGLDYVSTLERLRKSGTRYQYLARRVPATKAEAALKVIKDRGFKGITVDRDPMRNYPSNDVAANLIGFLGEDEPLRGMERTFDGQLAGTDGKATYEVGAGYRIPLGESTTVKPKNGETLQLTIDRDVQYYTQRALAAAVRKAGAESGRAVVLDTKTGQTLALADVPTFNANKPFEGTKKGDLGARSLSNPYEPGSVQKALTFAALIDAGKVSARTRIVVPSELKRPGAAPIGDHWDHDKIKLTAAGVLAKSSNIGTVIAAKRLESTTLYDYLRAFGLGSKTGIGVPGETAGVVADGSTWSSGTHDTIAFGQGLNVNAMQMAAAINTIANGGTYVSPSLVMGRATTDTGQQVGTDEVKTRRVVSEDAARQTTEMMELVTAEGEAGSAAAVPNYRVAGKTGTAQRVGKTCRCYDGTFTVSFAGFAPADDARFTVYVVIDGPTNGMGGGGNAGPVFKQVMTYLLGKYGVKPTGTTPSTLPIEW
ncbi:peptidoglycan D,D-transpeptidase FtsI family protein [Nocardioides sp. Bht2]|uniref:peptidoglycan D,D-transpeptidase FtsI family protein n=1 Tax=Nocardioides sp. Bht2 TaxID=3392297 RepID=UPI0039B5B387